MKNGKALFLLLFLVILAGLIGCSSSSSGGGSPAPAPPPTPQTPTQKLVGSWNFVSSTDGFVLGKLNFNANGTGDWNGSGFHGGRIDNGVFYFTLDSGQDEAFDIAWSNNDNRITLTNHNGGASYVYSRA
jgi:hypothetical protein